MLKRNNLDFEIIATGNPKTIVFLDSSEYFESPDKPILKIIPPGFNKFFTVNVAFGKINTFNSSTIGFSEVLDTSCLLQLPDGVWTFTYMICPYDKLYVTKHHLRTAQLDRIINGLLLEECDCCINSDFEKSLIDIWLLIEKGKAAAEENEPAKSSEAYQKALKKANTLLDKVRGCC